MLLVFYQPRKYHQVIVPIERPSTWNEQQSERTTIIINITITIIVATKNNIKRRKVNNQVTEKGRLVGH